MNDPLTYWFIKEISASIFKSLILLYLAYTKIDKN